MQTNAPTSPDLPQDKTKRSMVIYATLACTLLAVVAGVVIYNNDNTQTRVSVPDPVTELESSPPVILPLQEKPLNAQDTTMPVIKEKVATAVPVDQLVVVEPPKELPPALPTLDQSDRLLLEKSKPLSWLPNYTKLLLTKDMMRNFVTFVDNLARGDLATKFTPLKRPTAKFTVRDVSAEMYLDEASYKRYDIYVAIINSFNIELAFEHYQQLMPLIDEAYMELGYEKDSFSAVFIQAIQTLLDAPIIREPIKLVAPSAMYKFADENLEQLPAAQKFMLRIGPDNATKLRPKLQQIKLALEALD